MAFPSRLLQARRLPATAPRFEANKWVVFGVTAVGVFMASLDSSIVNIALPAIATSFGVSLNGLVAWVTIAYLVVLASALLTIGRLADLLGQRLIWSIGLIIFTLSSALCGLVPTLGFLVATRALQGLGAAFLLAISPAMLTSGFPANERGRALGLSAVNVALAVSAGPTLGGIILATLSWRWIFYVNVPLGLFGLLATMLFLKQERPRTHGRFDLPGAALLACGLAGLTLCLSFGNELGWTSPLMLACLIGSLIALGLLIPVEARVSAPIIDGELLRRRVFLSSLVSLILAMMALYAVSFMLPFYLEQLRGFAPQLSGILLTPLALALACIAPFSGALADHLGTRWLTAGGLALSCLGLFLLAHLDLHSTVWDVTWRLIIVGGGQALFQSPNSSALMGAAPRERQGVASGFLATSRVIGQSISVALASALFSGLGGAQAGLQLVLQRSHAHTFAAQPALQATFLNSFQTTLLVCAALAALGVLTSLMRGQDRRR